MIKKGPQRYTLQDILSKTCFWTKGKEGMIDSIARALTMDIRLFLIGALGKGYARAKRMTRFDYCESIALSTCSHSLSGIFILDINSYASGP